MSDKFWYVTASPSNQHETYELAEIAAKRKVAGSDGRCGYEKAYIMEVVAVASSPVPAIEVTKL